MWSASRFRALSTGDKFRLCIAALLLTAIEPCLSALSFSRVREALLRIAVAGAPLIRGSTTPDRIAWAVNVVDGRLPGSRICLVRSLTTEAMLRLYGHTPRHKIGVDRRLDGTLEAHSWIECEGRILVGDIENLSEFDTLPPLE